MVISLVILEVEKFLLELSENGGKIGINKGNIGACCKNKRNTAGKFKWQFKNILQ